jgi:sugar lactone lactonase YvrE
MGVRTGALALLACLVATAIPITARAQGVPRYAVDRSWPKTFPDRWVLGGIGGLCVDAHDHLFILHRQDAPDGDLNAGRLAPPVIEVDAAGNLINSWGDPKLLDQRLHSCAFDKAGNIWIGSAPSGMVQKYTHDGKLLLQVGKKGTYDTADGTEKGAPLNSNAAVFTHPSSIYIDPANGDVYVSDGEQPRGNRRIVVMDYTGKFMRQWTPDAKSIHCMTVANDGLFYICDRPGSRILVYDKMGKAIKSFDVPWTPYTPPADGKAKESGGVVVSLDLSRDAKQSLMYLVNQNNDQVEILDRQTGRILSSFGDGAGHFAGQLDLPHGIAIDSRGNVYVAENRGRRVQKFVIVGR